MPYYTLVKIVNSGQYAHDPLASLLRGDPEVQILSEMEEHVGINEFVKSLRENVEENDGKYNASIDFGQPQLGRQIVVVETDNDGDIASVRPIEVDLEHNDLSISEKDLAIESIALGCQRLKERVMIWLELNSGLLPVIAYNHDAEQRNLVINQLKSFITQVIADITVPEQCKDNASVLVEQYLEDYYHQRLQLLAYQQQQQQQQQKAAVVDTHFNQLQIPAGDLESLRQKVEGLNLKLNQGELDQVVAKIAKERLDCCPITYEARKHPVHIVGEKDTYELEAMKKYLKDNLVDGKFKSPMTKISYELNQVVAGYGYNQKSILKMEENEFQCKIVAPVLHELSIIKPQQNQTGFITTFMNNENGNSNSNGNQSTPSHEL